MRLTAHLSESAAEQRSALLCTQNENGEELFKNNFMFAGTRSCLMTYTFYTSLDGRRTQTHTYMQRTHEHSGFGARLMQWPLKMAGL